MNRAAVSTLIPLALLAACSGGSSNFDGRNDPPPPAGLSIDPANAPQALSAAYAAALASGDLAGLAGSTGLTADAGGDFAKPGLDSRAKGIVDQIVREVPIGPDVYDCIVAGTVTISADIVDPLVLASGMLSAGDTFLVEYDNCDDGVGEVIHGTIDMIVDAFTGDILVTQAYDMTMTMDVTDLQVTTTTDVLSSNGDATATLNTLQAPYVEASVSGNAMTMDTNTASESLSDYSSAQTLDAGVVPSPYTLSASGTLDSSQLSGVVVYSTPVTFEGFDVSYPHAGEFLVTGENSSARLIAVDDVNVRIEIDTDGNGSVDETINTTWDELANL